MIDMRGKAIKCGPNVFLKESDYLELVLTCLSMERELQLLQGTNKMLQDEYERLTRNEETT